MSLQITGADEVLKALENGVEIKLVLVDREEDCTEIIQTVSYTHLTLPTILLV